MRVSMDFLEIGKMYDRPYLAKQWGYKAHQAISRGIVTPVNDQKIILFITKIKQRSETQYHDYFIEKNSLHMEGETNHQNDKRIINAQDKGDVIYLFYRDIHHSPFVYFGQVNLVEFKAFSEKPSEFIFKVSPKSG